MFKVGIIGAGWIAHKMAQALAPLKEAQVYAIASRSIEKAQEFAQQYAIPQAYGSYEELVDDPEVDLVYIATPHSHHYPHTRLALEHGKHVLVEKAFTANLREAEQLIALAQEKKLFITEAIWTRYMPYRAIIRELIDSGKLGSVYEIKLTRNGYQRRNDWQTIHRFGGGQLLNWGPHIVDHSLRFCGGAYTKMYSEIRHVAAAGDCEDHIKIVFTGVNGRIVDMEISGGSIRIDGKDVRDVTQESLRRNIGIVQQDVFLFAATVLENIRYGRPDATMDEVIEAAKKAEIYDDIMQMPGGFDAEVGERGVKLSGGQKQRISIARMFLKNPPILILDEATSSIDTRTEQKIQSAFHTMMQGRTSFIVAHRLSTIREADLILVMRDGNIIEQGNHASLLAENGYYAELYSSQFIP